MRSRVEMAVSLLQNAHDTMAANVVRVSLDEAVFVPRGGYRSILGTLKHAAGWSHVYRSYAFDPVPQHWREIDWPWGLRDTVDRSAQYLADVIDWFHAGHREWLRDLGALTDEQIDEPRPLHWGAKAPLFDIVVLIATHHIYHAGELNQVLSIARGEAWEEGEEVEENTVDTLGHRVRPSWLDNP